ncbi:proline-rich protein 15-like protein B [Narcine bancroftii]|uniref:proline-rich protein 15-like protein B n=1 Tax=Narcine bancroftii TaxID=1343680 RepID=UPI003831D4CB
MGDGAPQSWWKFTFLRKKNGSKVLSELPVERGSNTESADRESKGDSQLEARLEKIMEKSTEKSTKGRHVRVSHSGRFKEKKKVRSSLSENPSFFSQAEKAGGGEP